MTTAAPLRRRVTEAASWTGIQLVLSHGMRLASNLVLTRLLAPDAFGLIGLALTVLTALTLLTDIGITQSIIRERDGDSPAFLRAAWRIKILRGMAITACTLVVALLVWLFAPALVNPDSAYAHPALPGLIAASAATALLSGFESTCTFLAVRRMDMRRIALLQIAVHAMTILFTIGFALLTHSAWAIALGTVSGAVINLILSHTAYPGPRMAWHSDPDLTARLWTFGRWIILSSSLTFLQTNADKLVLAALLGPTAFGHYIIALLWVEAAIQPFAMVRNRVIFPALSEILLHRPADFARLYRRLQRIADLYLLVAFLVLHLGAATVIDLLYTDSFADSAHFLALACIAIPVARFQFTADIPLAMGDSRTLAAASAIRSLSLALALPLGWHFGGTDGLIMASTLHPLAQVPYLLWKVRGHIPGFRMAEDLAALAFPFLMLAFLNT